LEDLLTIYIFLTVGLLIDPWRDDPEVSSGDEIDPENVSFEETISLLCCKICGLRYASLRYRSWCSDPYHWSRIHFL